MQPPKPSEVLRLIRGRKRAGNAAHVVEVARGIRLVEVERGRYDAAARGVEAHQGLEHGRRAHGVAETRLDRVHRHRAGTGSEDAPQHRRLDRVVERRARAVGADEVDLRRRHVCLSERRVDGALEPQALGVGRRDVRRVAGAAVPEQRAEPRSRHLALAAQQDQRGGLAQKKPAPASVERPDLVARQRPERIEAPHHEAAEDVVTARHDRIGFARPEQLGPERERGGAGGAGRRDGDGRPATAEPAGEIVGGRIVEGIAYPAAAPISREDFFPLLDASERGADDDGDACGIGRAEVALRGELVGGGHEQPGGTAIRHATPRLDPRQLLDLPAATHAQIADGEALDLGDARGAGAERGPEGLDVLAEGRHHPRRFDRDPLGASHRDPQSNGW